MKRLLLDVNVVLDILLNRQPHASSAVALWSEIETGRAKGLLSAHAVTTIHYLVSRDRCRQAAGRALLAILAVCKVSTVNDDIVRSALALEWPDFEDAVCAASAAAQNCDAIVTRDQSGFPDSPVPVMDAGTALTWLRA